MTRSFPSNGGPAFAICAFVANERRDDIPLPPPIGSAEARPPSQPDGRGVDGFLTERSESLALKRRIAVADLAPEEEGLQAIVGRPGEDHAAQDLAALVSGQRRLDRRAAEEAVADVQDLLVSLLETRLGARSRRRLGQSHGNPHVLQAPPKLPAKRRPERVQAGLIGGRVSARHRLERVQSAGERQRMTLGDERAETGGDSRQFLLPG